jgi:hypothetical protein
MELRHIQKISVCLFAFWTPSGLIGGMIHNLENKVGVVDFAKGQGLVIF